ncbi:MAG: hypothetical protein KDB61_13005, partial [Planctomycetes bacterium]|nr:hypothetical protein [Planctomycetota bacterium]
DWWSEGLIPDRVQAELESLNVTVDGQGHCNLFENLLGRPGGSQISPFFDGALLGRPVHYEGKIERLTFEDLRASAGAVTLEGITFDVHWNPEGECSAVVEGGLGTFLMDIAWRGMGDRFELGSLKGRITFEGPTAELERWLGFPGGLTGSMQDQVGVSLKFLGNGQAGASQVPAELRISTTLIQGTFDGHSFKMAPREEPANWIMPDFAGIDHVLAGLSAGLPEELGRQVRLAMEPNVSWTWILQELETAVTPIDRTLPLFEGLLASSRMEWKCAMNPGLNLAPVEFGGDTLELGKSTLNWRYDPEVGGGRGSLIADMPLVPENGNLALLGMSRALRKAFQFEWTTPGPMPGSNARMESASLSHTLTRYFASYLPAWGESLPQVLGDSCEVQIRRLDPGNRAAKHGGLIPTWQVGIRGTESQEQADWTLYIGHDRDTERVCV